MHIGVLVEQGPIEPTGLVVLAVGVVVAALRAADLVAHQDHRHAQREQGDRQEVLHPAVAESFDGGVGSRAFDATIPAPVVVGAVAISLAVGLVVLLVVGNQVVQGEAVMAGDEVNALLGLALLMAVNLGAADQPVGEAPERALRAAQEIPRVVAEPSVPLLPTVAHKVAHLVKAGSIPGLGDELGARQQGVRLDVPDHRRTGHHVARGVTREDRGEIEAEAVHMHLGDPVAEAVQNEAADDGMVGIEGVAGAAVVGVAGAVGVEDVVGVVLQAAEAERRSALVALGGVVEDNVEDDFQGRPVQRLNHVPELVERPERVLARAIGRVRREERDRRVAPIIDLARRGILRIELKDGQQLDGGDAEFLEVGDLLDQAGIGAALCFGHS